MEWTVIPVVVDTREKTPWDFTSEPSITLVQRKLDTGDYSIEGMEDILCIERKKGVEELAGNVTAKRFTRELERMMEFPYKFLILEFSEEKARQFPQGTNIPAKARKHIRVSGKFIMRRIHEIEDNYHVDVRWCRNRAYAEQEAINIIKKVWDEHKAQLC